jgi:hypothetical protein
VCVDQSRQHKPVGDIHHLGVTGIDARLDSPMAVRRPPFRPEADRRA